MLHLLLVYLVCVCDTQRPWIIDLMWQFRHRMLHLRFSEILLVLFRFLRRHPELISLEDMLRLLRKAEAYQPDEARKRSLKELAADILIQNDRLSRAYDILSQPVLMQYSRVATVRQGHDKFLGLIRKHQLLSQLSETDSFAMNELNNSEHATFRRYENNPAIWARTGRTSREIVSEAETHFHRYLDQNPNDTGVVLHLVELYMTEGNETGTYDGFYIISKGSVTADSDGHVSAIVAVLQMHFSLQEVRPRDASKILMHSRSI